MSDIPVRIPIPRAPVWIVVADASRARLKGQDLVSDDTGRTFDRAGTGRHGKEPVTDPREAVEVEFARELAEHLREAAQEGQFEKLYLVAPPSFLGELRAVLPDGVRKLVASELSKDLTRQAPQQIRDALPEIL